MKISNFKIFKKSLFFHLFFKNLICILFCFFRILRIISFVLQIIIFLTIFDVIHSISNQSSQNSSQKSILLTLKIRVQNRSLKKISIYGPKIHFFTNSYLEVCKRQRDQTLSHGSTPDDYRLV